MASPSTLSRLLNGKAVDMGIYLKVCDWLEIHPASLFKDKATGKSKVVAKPDLITAIRANHALRPDIASALAELIKALERKG